MIDTMPYRLSLFATLLIATTHLAAQTQTPKAINDFLDKHCMECHDEFDHKGNLNLEILNFDMSKSAIMHTWQSVFDRVDTDEMPPKKKRRPDTKERQAFLEQLRQALLQADRENAKTKGSVNVRRLTRREYEYTVHDLLGVDIPLQEHLPEETSTHGFETVADGQQLSHFNLAAYLQTADLALAEAFNRVKHGDASYDVTHPPKVLAKRSRGNYRGPEDRDGHAIAWPIRVQFYGRMPQTRVPESGWYRITVKDVHAINPIKNQPVWGTLRSGACSSNAPILYMIGLIEATKTKRDISYDAWIRKGHLLELKPNDITLKRAANGGKDGGHVSYDGRNLTKDGYQGIAFSAINVKRIYPNAPQGTVQSRLFAWMKKEDREKLNDPEARKEIIPRVIRSFVSRAFRRPTKPGQVKPYIDLAMRVLDEPNATASDALHAAYRAVLCSPRFLTLVEQPGFLDAYAIATRLSYALWNSLPDKPLLDAAKSGELASNPKVFHAQVRRMLDIPKFDRFVASFADQWLNLDKINFTTPDARRFRTFDSVVQESMVQETRAFLREIILSNLPIQNIIHSDFNMLNERLARFYDLKNIPVNAGNGIQRVSMKKNPRGGLISQGAIMKITADGTTTSPIVRGVWIRERLLGLDIPAPPSGVPAVEPDIRGAVSIRDQLIKHRDDPTCAACHLKLDPAGFAVEMFDPVGRVRTKYGTAKNAAKVDPSGVTPNGEPFKNLSEWKGIYTAKPDLLTRGFVKHLLTYATGAAPRFSDRQAIEDVIATARKNDYKMRPIIHATLASPVFRAK